MIKSNSIEEYLKIIYELEQENGKVRLTDIAKKKGCSKPSVNRAIKVLDSKGFLKYEAYGKIDLTEEGKKEAEKIKRTGLALKAFLMNVLEVPEEVAEKEAESMKYAVSENTVQKLEAYIESILDLEEFDCCYNGKRKKCQECKRIKTKKKEEDIGKNGEKRKSSIRDEWRSR